MHRSANDKMNASRQVYSYGIVPSLMAHILPTLLLLQQFHYHHPNYTISRMTESWGRVIQAKSCNGVMSKWTERIVFMNTRSVPV